jgi:tetratricopeptide (TPR) repeat protein
MEQAIALEPNYVTAHFNLGVIFSSQNQPERAIAAYRESLRLKHEQPSAHEYLGSELMRINDLDNAEKSLREAIRLNDRAIGAYSSLGWLFLRRDRPGDLEKAAEGASPRFLAACATIRLTGEVQADAVTLRRLALGLLREDYKQWVQRSQTEPDLATGAMQRWREEPMLAPVRDEMALRRLPEPERAAWQQFWSLVGLQRK